MYLLVKFTLPLPINVIVFRNAKHKQTHTHTPTQKKKWIVDINCLAFYSVSWELIFYLIIQNGYFKSISDHRLLDVVFVFGCLSFLGEGWILEGHSLYRSSKLKHVKWITFELILTSLYPLLSQRVLQLTSSPMVHLQ